MISSNSVHKCPQCENTFFLKLWLAEFSLDMQTASLGPTEANPTRVCVLFCPVCSNVILPTVDQYGLTGENMRNYLQATEALAARKAHVAARNTKNRKH